MKKQASASEPTQRTPKNYEIPVPKREEFFRNLKKAANANPPPKRPAKAKD